MRLLIVEDDEFKLTQLEQFVATCFNGCEIISQRSFQSGLRSAIQDAPDVTILDMNLPNYDLSSRESGYMIRPFAGRDILRELRRRQSTSKVIVVTQFDKFGEGDDTTTLNEIRETLREEFPSIYRGTVYYHPAREDWKDELKELLKRCV